MTHAGGRPRKDRKEEYCLCCGNKGYKRLVRSYNPKYKQTTMGSYYRFRHDDRKFICPKCHMNECYVDHLIKGAQRKEYSKNPPDKLMRLLLDSEKQAQRFKKFLFREMTVFKSWPITNEENKIVDNAMKRAVALEYYCLKVIDLIASITALYHIMELKTRLRFDNGNDAKIEELIKDVDSDMEILTGFESEYLEIGSKQVMSMLEPLRQVISDLDPKYGEPQRKKKKDDLRNKLRDTYNYPKRTLSH